MTESNKTARLLRMLSGAFLLITALGIFAFAQTNKGTISGTVRDAQGAVVPDADVTVTNSATGISRTVKTNEEGVYQVPLLDIGTYRISVSKTGFQTLNQENVILQTASETSIDVELPTGSVTSEVTVTAETPLVETETSERGSVITGREVTELPLSGRNFTQLATLTPGVSRSSNTGFGGGPDGRSFNNGDPRAGSGGPGSGNSQGSTETSRFARSGGSSLSVNGQRPTNNNFSLDGVDNNEPQFGTIGVFPNPDVIAEFKVTTSIPPAEVGRAAGAVITTTTKSGTNDFHGSGYYYGQNSALNAYHPILKRDRANAIMNNALNPPEKAVQQIHEFGATFGGPIIRNRLFFFFDYLGQRNNLPFPAQTAVPTANSRRGIFSSAEFPIVDCDGDNNLPDGLGDPNDPQDGPVCNPFTGTAFANGTIPANLINSVGSAFLNAYPSPSINVFNPNTNRQNYFTQRANKEEINNYGIKLDFRVSDLNSLTGRFNDQALSTVRANLLPGLPTAGFGAGDEIGDTRQLVITDTHTFSPTLLNEFRFGLTNINISIFNCGVGGACGTSETFAEDIGMPNANLGTLETSGGAGLGVFGDGRGGIEYTGDGGLFQVKSKNPYFADTFTIIRGNHVIKIGGEARLRYLETIDGGRSGFLKGEIQYSNGFGNECCGDQNGGTPIAKPIQPGQVCPAQSTAPGGLCYVDPNGVPYGGTGNVQADLLLALPARFVRRGQVEGGPFEVRTQEYGLFVQDDWKVSDSLTLNLGLRYDLFTPPTEGGGRLSYYDPEQRRVIVAEGSGDRIVETDKNNFGPRIGFAYTVNDEKSFVIRGGYGLLYTIDGTDYPPGIRNPPFTTSVSIFQAGQSPLNRTYFSVASGPPLATQAINPNTLEPSGNIPFPDLYAVDAEQRNGMVHQFQLSAQYQFGRDYSIDVAYVGNRSRNLLTTLNIGSGGTAEARNAAGNFLGNVLRYSNVASSSYDALQIQLQKRLSNNFQGQISYTWGHAIDNATGVFNSLGDSRNGGRSGPINPFDLDADRGNSSLDVRHLLTASAIIDLPFGKGRAYLNQGGIVDKFVGGFQANLIFTARTGFPFTVVCNNGIVRPNQIGDPFANVPAGRFFNAAAFDCNPPVSALTSVTNPAGAIIRYGSLGRNSFTGPAYYNTDFSVFKNTAIMERVNLQLGIEFFNLFNQTRFTVPENNAGDAGNFGRLNGAFPARVIQYRAKVIF